MYGHFVRDRHEVLGQGDPYRGETLYRWDADAITICFIYFNAPAGVSEGTPTGTAIRWRSTAAGTEGAGDADIWRRRGSDAYIALTERRTAEGREVLSRRFHTPEARAGGAARTSVNHHRNDRGFASFRGRKLVHASGTLNSASMPASPCCSGAAVVSGTP